MSTKVEITFISSSTRAFDGSDKFSSLPSLSLWRILVTATDPGQTGSQQRGHRTEPGNGEILNHPQSRISHVPSTGHRWSRDRRVLMNSDAPGSLRAIHLICCGVKRSLFRGSLPQNSARLASFVGRRDTQSFPASPPVDCSHSIRSTVRSPTLTGCFN